MVRSARTGSPTATRHDRLAAASGLALLSAVPIAVACLYVLLTPVLLGRAMVASLRRLLTRTPKTIPTAFGKVPDAPLTRIPPAEHRLLTARQGAILDVIAGDPTISVSELARMFGVGNETMKKHLADIYRRLGVQGGGIFNRFAALERYGYRFVRP
jgi:DNA-binding CsgD family transcriptional regulator